MLRLFLVLAAIAAILIAAIVGYDRISGGSLPHLGSPQVTLGRPVLTDEETFAKADVLIKQPASEPTINVPVLDKLTEKTRIIFAIGHCSAGLNYKLHEPRYDVDSSGTTLTITLLEPEIFECHLVDPTVFDGQKFLGFAASDQVTNDLYKRATELAYEDGPKTGILKDAKQNAEEKIRLRHIDAYKAVGLSINVVINWVKP